VRPQMFTFALTSLLLWLVEHAERRPWVLCWIPPIFLFWLNLHAGFVLAPILLLAYAAGLVMESALGDVAWSEVRTLTFRLLILAAICLALVPLNPSGAQLYHYPFDTLRSTAMRKTIVEWFSADFHQARYAAYMLVWLVLTSILALRNYRPRTRVLVPLILTGGLSLDAVRHIPIFVLLAAPVIAAGLSSGFRRSEIGATRRLAKPSFAIAALALMAGFTAVRWSILIRDQGPAERKNFPANALEVLKNRNFGGQIFAYYDWGGYTIFRLYPKYQVFVDGRADLYGEDLVEEFRSAMELRAGWRQVMERWHLRVVLIPPNSALAQALTLDPGWHTEYRDAKAVLFVREGSAGDRDRATKPSPSSRKSARMDGEDSVGS